MKVNEIKPIHVVQKRIVSVDENDYRALTNLRRMIEDKEIAANAVLRECFVLISRGCISCDTFYAITGVCFQNGAKLGCLSFEYLNNQPEIQEIVDIMDSVQKNKGICPLDAPLRNWLASLLNRNDGWEGGINCIPEVFMEDFTIHVFRAVTTGSNRYYRAAVQYVKNLSCDLTLTVLKEIVHVGFACMDLAPILYAVKEDKRILDFAKELIGEVEPKDECSREGLLKLHKVLFSL